MMKAEEKLTPIGLGEAWVNALKEAQERFGQILHFGHGVVSDSHTAKTEVKEERKHDV